MSDICFCIGSVRISAAMEFVKNHDFIEIRQDLADFSEDDIWRLIKKSKRVIFTHKQGTCSEEERLRYYLHAINCGAHIVDVEATERDFILERIKSFAHSRGAKIIYSNHLTGIPRIINQVRADMYNYFLSGVDYIKYAIWDLDGKAQDFIDKLYKEDNVKGRLIAFTLGARGISSRLAAIKNGAPFIYVVPDGFPPTAQMQPTYSDYLNAIGEKD